MTLPSAVLDLSVWKLTLPTGSKGSPTEIGQKELITYPGGPWFSVNATGTGVSFRAPVNGVTTSGSSYPRSELREMTAAGKNASWAAKTGWHVLSVVESFDHLPLVKPHLVGAQIHDAKNDWSVFRLEGSKLYITAGNNTHYHLVTDSYVLGTPYLAQYVVAAGKISAYYNGALATTLDAKKLKGAYFKAGAYTQANCTNSSPCSADNYGQTTVYHVSAIHADKPGSLPTPPVPGRAPTPTPVPVPTPIPVPSGSQILGVGGIPAPAPGPTVFLAVADTTAPLVITKPGIYDGLGHKVGRITVTASGVTVQNYRIVAGGQYGAVLDANDVVFQNNDISGVSVSGDGDLNAITAFGNNLKIRYNTAINFVVGDPGASHTDFIQTWVSSSHPVASMNWEIVGNKAVGPANPSRDNAIASIHQFLMVEGAGQGGNTGGSGQPTGWLIADNIVGDSWGQAIKLDGARNFTITGNQFIGSSDTVIEVTPASSGVAFLADNKVGPGYGSVGMPVPVPGTGDVVMVIRHGEKPADPNSHILSATGQKRAVALADLFSAVPIRAGLHRPDRIYASEGTTASLRPFQTVKPLADKLGELEITKWAAADNTKAGQEIAGLHGVTLVCWAHTELPGVCTAFGVKTPSSWPDDRFDVIWIFTRTATGWAFSQLPEMLLPGDKSSVL